MPEGDTIRKIAESMDARLNGQTAVRVATPQLGPTSLRNTTIEEVAAHGKHLFIHFETAPIPSVLRSHLGMRGSWHHYRPRATWQRSAQSAGIILETTEDLYVCFAPKEVAWMSPVDLRDWTQAIGPNLLDVDPSNPGSMQAILKRIEALDPDTPVSDVLLNQHIAAGIGNAYKSELLFLMTIPPTTKAAMLASSDWEALYRLAQALLRANLNGGPRITHPGPAAHLWVYDRAGKPCLRCRTTIERVYQSQLRRSTYFCPSCQAPSSPRSGVDSLVAQPKLQSV
jgi:endonuclease VIII